MDTHQHAQVAGIATGRREAAERMLGSLRRQATQWRASEAKAGGLVASLRSALLWAVTERWASRVEAMAAQLESDLAELRTAEQQALEAYRKALAEPVPTPANPVPARKRRR